MVDKQTMQNISEASAAKWRRLHELEAENARLQALVRSGEDHEEDCDYRNLSGDLKCNCAGGRARATLRETKP